MVMKQVIILVQRDEGAVEVMKETSLDLVTLPHPKGAAIVYIQIAGEIMELQSIEPKKHASWFINQKVSSSSTFYMASKLDPRFLCLPFLEKYGSKYSPLDQIITLSDLEGCSRIPLLNSSKWKLEEISDVKDLGDDLILYRFNEEKTLQWLNQKIDRTAAHFMSKRQSKKLQDNTLFAGTFELSAKSSARSSNHSINDSTKCSTILEPEKVDIQMAFQVVSDYLTVNMTELLMKKLGISGSDLIDTKLQSSKRKADWENELEVYLKF
jgi:ribonuclease H2 subunit B